MNQLSWIRVVLMLWNMPISLFDTRQIISSSLQHICAHERTVQIISPIYSCEETRWDAPTQISVSLTRPSRRRISLVLQGPDCEIVSQESDYNVLKTASHVTGGAQEVRTSRQTEARSSPSQTHICHTPWCFSLSDIYKHPVEMKMYYSLSGAQTEDWSCFWKCSGTSRQQLH